MMPMVSQIWPDRSRRAVAIATVAGDKNPWRIVVAAENPVIHDAVAMVLSGARVLERPVEILHAGNSGEAMKLLNGGRWVKLEIDQPFSELQVYLERNDLLADPRVPMHEVFAVLAETAFRTENLLDRLRSLKYFDQLCKLPNRPLFLSMLETALCERKDWAVAIVDIDHFSTITNALGYPLGDALLKAVAERLQTELEPLGYRLARIGTDNFAMLAPAGDFDFARVLALFGEPLEACGYPLHVSATLGMAYSRDVQGGAESLLKCASTALKTAKQQARGSYSCFAPTMAQEIEERVRLAYDLKNALADATPERGGLDVHYQPQVDLGDGRPVGVEALARWRHPQLGMVMPDRFIFIAERAGLIVDLGEYVLERACRDQVEWCRRGLRPLRVAVNVSMQQFKSPRFLAAVKRVLAETGIAPECLELEITESMLMGDVQAVVRTLYAVKAMGVTVALDDFGTGFSSLSHLRTLPIDRLKVDRLFVRDIGEGNTGAKIAEMIVSLARTLGKEIIAEGIEEAGVIETLRGWGCGEGQGYYYGRPMSREALEEWAMAQVRA